MGAVLVVPQFILCDLQDRDTAWNYSCGHMHSVFASPSTPPPRRHCEDLGRYQSHACGIFISYVTRDCVGVKPD